MLPAAAAIAARPARSDSAITSNEKPPGFDPAVYSGIGGLELRTNVCLDGQSISGPSANN